jgi:NADH-quinone oxidoreductase subunit M
MNDSILTLILLAPLGGAVVVALLPERGKLSAWLALLTSLASFGLALHLPAHFVRGQHGFQFETNRLWIELSPGGAQHGIFYHVGVDGISLWLVVLVGLLGPIGVVASWNAIKERQKNFSSFCSRARCTAFLSRST